MSEKDFVTKIAPYAMKDAEASGILASVTMAPGNFRKRLRLY